MARSIALRLQDRLKLNTSTKRKACVAALTVPVLMALAAFPLVADYFKTLVKYDGDRSKSQLWLSTGMETTPCVVGNVYISRGSESVTFGAPYPTCVESYAIIWPSYFLLLSLGIFLLVSFCWMVLDEKFRSLREWMKGPSAPLTIRNDGWPHLHVSFVAGQEQSPAPFDSGIPPAVRSMTIEEHIASLGVQSPCDTERFKPPAQTHN